MFIQPDSNTATEKMGETLFTNVTSTDRPASSLKVLFASLPAVVCEFDTDLRLIRYSKDSQLNFTGVPPSFLLGRRLKDLLLEKEDKYAFLENFEQLRILRKPIEFTTLAESSRDSSSIRTICDLILSETGEVIGYSTICMVSQTVSKAPSDAVDKLFDAMGSSVIRVNSSKNITYANGGFFGKPHDSILGQCIEDYFEDDERTVVRAACLRVLSDGTPLSFTVSLTNTGTPKWFVCLVSPFVNSNDETESVLLFHEISGVKARMHELEEEVRLFSSLMGNIGDGVIAIDAEGKVTQQNPVATKLLGKHLRFINDIQDINLYHAKDNTRATTAQLPIVLALEGMAVPESELIIKDPSGQIENYIACSARPIKNSAGEVTGAVGLIRNNSEEHLSNDQLKKANENMDYFVQATAHDLKAPVDNMKNLIGLMDRIKDPEKRTVFEEKLKLSVLKLDDLLGALMEMVDSQRNTDHVQEELDLLNTFEFVLYDHQEELKSMNANVKYSFHAAENVCFIKAQLRSVFQNLLTNSIKYRHPDKELAIYVSSERIGDYVVVHFADNGSGMDLERYGQDLFKPFKRLTNKGEGKGIGLNLVKSFIDRNGGNVKVESHKGEGTKFHIFIKSPEKVV
ncbi:MAG: signal transduction histidine kinase [Flavobacteriales bacterium]